MSIKDELFDKLGELHIATNAIDFHKKNLENAYKKADKITAEVINLENRFVKSYKTLPDFY